MTMIIHQNGPQNIGEIETYFIQGDIFLSPEEYQRENSWDLQQKKLLIDTICQKMDIPKFYLWKINLHTLANGYPDGSEKELYKQKLQQKITKNDILDPYIFEVVDGQQRIRTILEFMDVKPPNTDCYRGIWNDTFRSSKGTPMAKGKYYSQFNAPQKIEFKNSKLTVMVIDNATIDEVRDMFLRLQNGTPLNSQQKRDATGSSICPETRKLAYLPFFKQSVNFDNKNSEHRLVASQMLQLELKDNIVSCTSRQLDKLHERYKGVPIDSSVVSRTRGIVEILGKIFPARNPHLNQNYALSLYWAISRILVTYDIPDTEYQTIRENFERLDIARLNAMDRHYSQKPDDEIYEDLSLAMSRGNTGANGISTRHEIICQYLFEGVDLKQHPDLDPQRNFTGEEKLVLYHRAKGCCQMAYNGKECGRAIPFDEAVVDHILPHSKGGTTTLDNGRIAFKSCNIARGNRDDFNPETDCRLLTVADTQEGQV